jgi:hypothetical protein
MKNQGEKYNTNVLLNLNILANLKPKSNIRCTFSVFLLKNGFAIAGVNQLLHY